MCDPAKLALWPRIPNTGPTEIQPPVRTNCNPTTYSLTSSTVPLFENAPLSPPLLRRRAPLPSRKQLFAPTSCPNTSRPEIPDQPGIIAGLATYPSPIYLFFRLAITKKPSLPSLLSLFHPPLLTLPIIKLGTPAPAPRPVI